MTKSEFIEHVASRGDLTRAEAARAVDAMLKTIEDTLSRGSDVTFSGFGKFHVTQRAEREGIHPRTGERIRIAALRSPKFTPGSGLKKSVNS